MPSNVYESSKIYRLQSGDLHIVQGYKDSTSDIFFTHLERIPASQIEVLLTLPSPTNLETLAQGESQINLVWTDNSNDEEGFKIERKTEVGGTWAQIDSVNTNVTSYQNTGLSPNTTYYYRVRAYNTAGNSAYSIEAHATTLQDVMTPTPPSNLMASLQSATKINLVWADNSSNEDGFYLERKIEVEGAWSQIDVINANITTHQDTGLNGNTTYYYRVRAYNTSGNSAYSNEASVTTPDTTLDLQIVEFPNGQQRLSWNAVPHANSYRIFCADEPLPTDDPSWTQLSETEGLFYVYNATTPSKFFYVLALTNSTLPEYFIYVPDGTFTMGRTTGTGETDELPTHTVTLNSFYISKCEVTQGEYLSIMGSNPALDEGNYYGVGTNYPVYGVSWYSAIKYCNLRSMDEGLTPVYTVSGSTNPANWGEVPTYDNNTAWDAAICNWNANGYRLPTEAEWEYAARGGANIPDYLYSGSDNIDTVAWYDNNSSLTSHIAGTKAPNGLGIYDMTGNVWEWCWDWYSSSYYSSSPASNPTGASSGSFRILRGGYWYDYPSRCRVVFRNRYPQYGCAATVGFRVCRSGV